MMENVKKGIGRLMNVFMLSCEEASLLMTRKKYEKLPVIKFIQLKLHLLSCELCRRFDIHNDIIHNEMTNYFSGHDKMDSERKAALNARIEKELKQ